MAQIAPAVEIALKGFLDAVRRELQVDGAYLFGSAARGEAGPDSDIDVAIVSETFRGMRRVDVIALLMAKSRGLGVDLQPIGLTPEELEEQDNAFTRNIVDEGISII